MRVIIYKICILNKGMMEANTPFKTETRQEEKFNILLSDRRDYVHRCKGVFINIF